MVLDGLDGRVARLTNTQSAFGAEYDSLSDMVAFGVAPALVAFEWALGSLRARSAGWSPSSTLRAQPCVWLVSTPRSARPDKRYFIGLASPAAAALVAGTVWAFSRFSRSRAPRLPSSSPWLVAAAGGADVVSTSSYHSFKDLDLRGRGAVRGDPYRGAGLPPVVFTDPPRILLLLFLAYAALRSCAIPAATASPEAAELM
ncbi:putative phosphatidylserine synthase [Pseudomonas aeruginosa]|nr:putative phosphatidylserine synthase [Pseudomonas aeruginosa]